MSAASPEQARENRIANRMRRHGLTRAQAAAWVDEHPPPTAEETRALVRLAARQAVQELGAVARHLRAPSSSRKDEDR